MRLEFLQEPELEFGTGKHVDIRFGLMEHGPLDRFSTISPKEIRLGIVGSSETIEGVHSWLDRCRAGVGAKKTTHPNLFPRFPGFGSETNLSADLVLDSQLEKATLPGKLEAILKNPDSSRSQKIEKAVDMFLSDLEYLKEKELADVFLVAVPMNLLVYMIGSKDDVHVKGDSRRGEKDAEIIIDFHDLLKARAMKLGKPVQVVLPMTYDDSKKLPQKLRKERVRELQDEATRAWNFYTALYYKAGGIPWRLIRDPTEHTVCYVGISFYKTLDSSKLLTSTAQIFNERGDGIILRGGAAKQSKDDRQIHLGEEDAYNLLGNALKAYREEHRNLPARLAVHKSTGYNGAELDGFKRAISDHNIELVDFLSLRDSFTRLYRNGEYPPLRGTLLSKDARSHVLYTRGGR